MRVSTVDVPPLGQDKKSPLGRVPTRGVPGGISQKDGAEARKPVVGMTARIMGEVGRVGDKVRQTLG